MQFVLQVRTQYSSFHFDPKSINNPCLYAPVRTYHLCTRTCIYCAAGKIEKNEMGGACGAYGGGERCAQGSGGET